MLIQGEGGQKTVTFFGRPLWMAPMDIYGDQSPEQIFGICEKYEVDYAAIWSQIFSF